MDYSVTGETKHYPEVCRARLKARCPARINKFYASIMGAALKSVLSRQASKALPATYPLPAYPSSLKVAG